MIQGQNSTMKGKIAEKTGVVSSFWDLISLLSSNLFLIPLGIISAAMTTRILGREGYGHLAIFSLMTQLVVMVTTNWTAAAVLRFGREEYDQRGRVNRTFWARGAILIPCLVTGGIAIYAFRGLMTSYMAMPYWVVWLVIGSVLLAAGRTYLDSILQAIHCLKGYAATQVVVSGLSILGLSLIILGIFEKTVLAVIVVGMVASSTAILLLFLFLVPRDLLFPIEIDRHTVRDVFSFSYPVILGNLAAYLVNWIDVMVIKHYFTLSDVGGYQLAYNTFNLFVGLIGSITVVMTPVLISFLASHREDLTTYYSKRLVPQGMLLGATMVGMGLGICPPLFRIFFGEGFEVSAIYFQFLAVGLVLSILVNCYSSQITAYKLIKLGMVASVARGLVNLLGDLYLVPDMGPLGAAVATTLGVAVAAVIYLLICQWRLKTGLLWQLVLLLPTLLSLGVNRFVEGRAAPFLAMGSTLAAGYLLARMFHVFKKEDALVFDYVEMPKFLRKAITWGYPFLSK